ncbi:acyl carrier protein [Allokutzneria sp. A3M-2-11 16]|uniref:acyl carrier protein n=1 Tax=Allokutzneria sp. A3M-2-11 16 TaxID=2962043 RepID=UPI0020B6F54B|nr:acyl carrier protein [Allokutzneria sp. A3M-2-11 16]MCP3798349.1 acyl carrier protein [Allokutzneria sp. A3M-2-11 16]
MSSTELTDVVGDYAAESAVLTTVRHMLVEVIGEDYALAVDIDMDTSFNRDLELESIEFVTLSAKLREHYGNTVNFAAFLGDKEVAEVAELTVGELVTYISGCVARD